MAARPSWADLPGDLIAEIVRRVPCPVDRVRVAWACRTWLERVLTDRCPLQLPWLLRPYQIDADLPLGTTRRASFFCVLCNRAHRVAVPDDTRGARFFGAYTGGWLFLAYGQIRGHRLINLRTYESLYLPDNIIWEWQGLAWKRPMLTRAATLSAPPALLEGCVGAAIVAVLLTPCLLDKGITFWRMGSRVASCAFRLDAEDVIYHNGAFHFLTVLGDLFLCTPEFQNEAPLEQLQLQDPSRRLISPDLTKASTSWMTGFFTGSWYASETGTLRYGCCNNGVWSRPPDHVRHWLPLQRPSTYSSPVWFLH